MNMSVCVCVCLSVRYSSMSENFVNGMQRSVELTPYRRRRRQRVVGSDRSNGNIVVIAAELVGPVGRVHSRRLTRYVKKAKVAHTRL